MIEQITGDIGLCLVRIGRSGGEINLLISSLVCSDGEEVLDCILNGAGIVIIHGYLPQIY